MEIFTRKSQTRCEAGAESHGSRPSKDRDSRVARQGNPAFLSLSLREQTYEGLPDLASPAGVFAYSSHVPAMLDFSIGRKRK
jgi:hypothetical protein